MGSIDDFWRRSYKEDHGKLILTPGVRINYEGEYVIGIYKGHYKR